MIRVHVVLVKSIRSVVVNNVFSFGNIMSDVLYTFVYCIKKMEFNVFKILVGDREHDILGARKAGLDCVAVSWGYGSMEELTKAEPLKIVNSAEELLDFFA